MVSELNMKPYLSWKKGEARSNTERIHTRSGAYFLVSKAEFEEVPLQVADALLFLRENVAEMSKAATYPGVDSAFLDFAVSLVPEQFNQTCVLSKEVLELAVAAKIGIEVTHYASSHDESEV